ncbi:MAG TPA: tyrosine-type recombinase/integrase [Candidatus Polarisedimenticolia bacterium]|nr:tyrosine-type recombinase/integrase [Candidatus Polarisedimenticolia bacterium]
MAIYKREGSEFYTYEFYFNGKRVRKCTDQTNKDVARDLMAVHRTRLAKGEAGIVEPNAAPLFKTFAADWLKGIKLKKCRNTHRCYADGVRALGEHFNGFTLDKIVAERIEEFRNKRLSEGLNNAGANRNLAVLRLVLRAAVKLGKLPRSPFGDGNVKLEKEKGFERILSYVEEEKYLAKANPKLKDIAVMMLECGLRPDEVFRIQKNEVDLRKRHLHVTDGKTGQRDVSLSDDAFEVMKHRAADAQGPYLFPLRKQKKGYDWQKPMTTIQKAHEAALESSGIKPEFRLYDLRHTYGTRTAESGVEALTLMKLMGHSDLKTTLRYVHLSKRHLEEAAKKSAKYKAERRMDELKEAVPATMSLQ